VDQRTLWCPKDLATRQTGKLKQLWIERPLKLTSYCWNGTIAGYPPRPLLPVGKTYRISDFLSTDWQLWQPNEIDSLNVNDAGNNPEALSEKLSLRHAGMPSWWKVTLAPAKDFPGGAVIGNFGGGAQFKKWNECRRLVIREIPAPNDILNGPA